VQENCKKYDFVIEYHDELSAADIGEYVMKLGQNQYIDGNINGNIANSKICQLFLQGIILVHVLGAK